MGFFQSLERSARGKSGSSGFRKFAKVASAPIRAAAAADPVFQKIRYGAVGSNTTRLNNASDILYDADPVAKNIGITQNAAREITKTAAAAAGIYFAAAGAASYFDLGAATTAPASGGYPYGAYPAVAETPGIGSTLASLGKQVGTALVGLAATNVVSGLLRPKTPDTPNDLVADPGYNPLTSLLDALSGTASPGSSMGGGGGGGGGDEPTTLFTTKNILIGLAVLLAAFFFLRR